MQLQPQPRSVAAAHALASVLAPPLSTPFSPASCQWAIGGSTLLHHLGIEAAPRDLDIVVTPAYFNVVLATLTAQCAPVPHVPHPRYASTHFARFKHPLGVDIDLMAGIAVRTPQGITHWQLDPAQIAVQNGLPWMRAQDWLHLYALFERPARVAQLTAYLQRAAVTQANTDAAKD